MEIVPRDTLLFRASIEAVKEFLPQAQLRISKKGIRINGMDASHVGFVDYFLSADDMTTNNVPKSVDIGINMACFARTFASVGNSDKVTIGTAKGGDKLQISYVNEKIGKKAVFEVPTLDIHEDALEIPDFTYGAVIEAKTADIATVIKEVGHFGDAISLTLDEHGFHVASSGDSGSVKQTLENTDDRNMEMNADSIQASFGTKYLTSIMKCGSPLASNTKLEFDASQPLRVSFRFGTSSYFIAYLAPKITDEE